VSERNLVDFVLNRAGIRIHKDGGHIETLVFGRDRDLETVQRIAESKLA
jgi:hypothetical protein